ncbi:MAG: beta-propeller domain-containing protein [Candidatus Buchananbacteria bacterium]
MRGSAKITTILFVISCFVLIFFGALIYLSWQNNAGQISVNTNQPDTPEPSQAGKDSKTENSFNLEMVKFNSEQDFKDYLKSTEGLMTGFAGNFGQKNTAIATDSVSTQKALMPTSSGSDEQAGTAERFSQTNIQVSGVDEPDIIKTDGQNIFFSLEPRYGITTDTANSMEKSRSLSQTTSVSIAPDMPQRIVDSSVKIIKAFKPADLKEISSINENGNLLLNNNHLIVIGNNKISAFDVSRANQPKATWQLQLASNAYLTDSRLYNGLIYLIIRKNISDFLPCPIEVVSLNNKKISVACQDVYHPQSPVNIDVTYTVMAIDPLNGEIKNQTSFVGSASHSLTYMSQNNIYATYTFFPDAVSFMYDFLVSKCLGLVPESLIEKLAKLKSYEISSAAKMTEFNQIMENFERSLDNDQQLELETELTNRLNQYLTEHQRELEKTGIVKIGIKNFSILATGQIPGEPLNQFCLDEYKNILRIATTISGGLMGATNQSVSDVYALDENLKELSSVKDLGKGEKIYSARFVGDRGYIVTFRQTDPFYVIDLTDPKNSKLSGELKIPGFSSYLHPIDQNLIIGIGQEQSKVKISLFDVSDPANLQEKAKYMVNEYWTEVANNHHAFLLDDKHQIFFLPASRGGYIFSYKDAELELEKAVSQESVKRAVYIDDYLYIISENKISVFSEITWEKIKELNLK